MLRERTHTQSKAGKGQALKKKTAGEGERRPQVASMGGRGIHLRSLRHSSQREEGARSPAIIAATLIGGRAHLRGLERLSGIARRVLPEIRTQEMAGYSRHPFNVHNSVDRNLFPEADRLRRHANKAGEDLSASGFKNRKLKTGIAFNFSRRHKA